MPVRQEKKETCRVEGQREQWCRHKTLSRLFASILVVVVVGVAVVGGGESLISGEGCQGVRGGKTVIIIKDGHGDSLQRRYIWMGKQPNLNNSEAELLTRCSCSQFTRPWLQDNTSAQIQNWKVGGKYRQWGRALFGFFLHNSELWPQFEKRFSLFQTQRGLSCACFQTGLGQVILKTRQHVNQSL